MAKRKVVKFCENEIKKTKTKKEVFAELEKIGWKESKDFIEPMFVIPYKDYLNLKNKFRGD